MKHLKNIAAFVALSVLAFASCQKDDQQGPKDDSPVINTRNISGVWMLTSIDGIDFDDSQYLYINLEKENLRFDIYENFNSHYSNQTVGEFFIDNDDDNQVYIDGYYTDDFGKKWNEHYYIKDFTLTSMTWVGADSGETQYYTRVDEIPADIVAGTRSK